MSLGMGNTPEAPVPEILVQSRWIKLGETKKQEMEYNFIVRSSVIATPTMMTLYKILAKPPAACASETWVLTNADKEALGLFEKRKGLRECVLGVCKVKVSEEEKRNLNYINYVLSVEKFLRIKTL